MLPEKFEELPFYPPNYEIAESFKPFAYGVKGPASVAYAVKDAVKTPGQRIRFATVHCDLNGNRTILREFKFMVTYTMQIYIGGSIYCQSLSGIASEDNMDASVLTSVVLDHIHSEMSIYHKGVKFEIFRLKWES